MKNIEILTKAAIPFSLKAATAVIGLLFNLVATQYLPVEEFGLFSLTLVLVITLVTITKLGLDNTLVKIVAVNKAKQNHKATTQTYSFVLLLSFISLLIISTGLWASQNIISNILGQKDLPPLFFLILATALPNIFLIINSAMLKGLQHANLSVGFNGLITLTLSSILTFIITPQTALELLQLVCFATYTSCILSFLLCFGVLKIGWSFNLTPLKQVTNSCFPLWISSLVALVIQQLSILVLSRYASLADIAIYSIAAKIAILMTFVLFAFNTILAPKFAALYATNQLFSLKTLAKQANKMLLLIAISISLFLYILSDELMALFGDEYIAGTLWLQILIFGQLVNVGTGAVVNLLIMTGHEKLHRNLTLFVALVTVILVSILIPKYGAIGAAIATAVSMSLQNLLSYYFAHKLILSKTSSLIHQ